MKKVSLLAFLLSGCGTTGLTALSATEKLLVAATSGVEEKSVSSGDASTPDDVPADQRPDLFRECDASATYGDLFGRFDADTDGKLDSPEQKEVDASWEGRPEGADQRILMQWGMLLLTYDLDGSGSLDESERATLLSDFTLRCQNLQTMLLEQFDADGDGVLSDSEKATAEETLESQAPEHHPGCDGMEGDSGKGEEMNGGRPEMGGPPEDAYTVGGVPVPPPLLEEFDADGDGSLSAEELSTLRSSLRERVTSGAPLMPPPPEGGHGK